jgi:hypothetical protein
VLTRDIFGSVTLPWWGTHVVAKISRPACRSWSAKTPLSSLVHDSNMLTSASRLFFIVGTMRRATGLLKSHRGDTKVGICTRPQSGRLSSERPPHLLHRRRSLTPGTLKSSDSEQFVPVTLPITHCSATTPHPPPAIGEGARRVGVTVSSSALFLPLKFWRYMHS